MCCSYGSDQDKGAQNRKKPSITQNNKNENSEGFGSAKRCWVCLLFSEALCLFLFSLSSLFLEKKKTKLDGLWFFEPELAPLRLCVALLGCSAANSADALRRCAVALICWRAVSPRHCCAVALLCRCMLRRYFRGVSDGYQNQ